MKRRDHESHGAPESLAMKAVLTLGLVFTVIVIALVPGIAFSRSTPHVAGTFFYAKLYLAIPSTVAIAALAASFPRHHWVAVLIALLIAIQYRVWTTLP